MSGFIGVNRQAQTADPGVPVLAIPHDDSVNPLGPFDGADVRLWRCMSPRSQLYRLLPRKAHVVGWNEMDQPFDWWTDWIKEVRANRPDLVIHYGAMNTAGQWPLNFEVLALCDVLDFHCPAFETDFSSVAQTAAMFTNGRWWVTEVEADPANPGQMNDLVPCAIRALEAGAEAAFLWGMDPGYADVNNHPEILAAVRQYNQGATTMADDPKVQQVLDQNALIADALYDLTKVLAQTPGTAGLSADQVVGLLQDAKTKVNALNPAKFTF